MARIRSVHPGLFTDESFVSCSPMARLLIIGLWTEADDQGVFEWKPITIKMRLLPVDNVDVVPLLEELTDADMAQRFERDGKSYGAIRNFRKYQRPKSPNAVHPMPDNLRTYVALDKSISETPQVKPDQFPPNGETAPQMEEGGGKVEEVINIPTTSDAKSVVEEIDLAMPEFLKSEATLNRDKVWAAIPWLVESTGESEADVRSRVGKLLKKHDPPSVLEALEAAHRENAVHALDYITAILAKPDATDPDYWEKYLETV